MALAPSLRSWLRRLLLGPALLGLTTCSDPLALCPPVEGRVGFFSKGDCVLTRASFFAGHEWLTFFANEDLPIRERFSEEEIDTIVEGNRRTDFPKELLVHLNTSALAYMSAVLEYQDRPENQPVHFLLKADNGHREAAADGVTVIRDRTRRASALWVDNRERALTLVGQACHTIQDSFSHAHAVRDPEHPSRPWCIRKLKSYVARAPGFDTPDIEYHGGEDGQAIGHTSVQDSIYLEGRDCHSPQGRDEVEACLSESATQARVATRSYLAVVRSLLFSNASEADIDLAMSELERRYFTFCDDP